MHAFEYNNLFQKSKLYVQRALNEDRESYLFPFWLSLSLELLSRSTLANVHPALLAEITGQDGANILYAFGYESTIRPKQIQISEVFNRLIKIGIEFTDVEKKICVSIIEQRNAELHSGITGFHEYPVSLWLGDFYRVCKILLQSQKLGLEDFLGSEEAKAAEIMIVKAADNLKKNVLNHIQSYKKVFFDLPKDIQDERIRAAQSEIRSSFNHAKILECPVCGSSALLSGELISYSDAKLEGDKIKREKRYLPTQFGCFACGIRINGYPELKSIDLGGQFTLVEELDPVDFHGIVPEEYIDIDSLVSIRLKEQDYYEEFGDE